MRRQDAMTRLFMVIHLYLQDDHEPMISSDAVPRSQRPRSFSESLHIFTSPSIIGGALSPNRTGKVSKDSNNSKNSVL